MSWIHELYEIYENNRQSIGYDENSSAILLPVFHSTNNAQVEIILDSAGNFLNANAVGETEAVTIIPVTMDSAARSSGVTPHPLCDKLIYLAGDYSDFHPKEKDTGKYFTAYIEGLKKWRDTPNAHPKVKAIYTYLVKASLIKDLVKSGILLCEESGELSPNAKIAKTKQSDVFLRFRIEDDHADPWNYEPRVWQDKSLYDCFIDYNRACHTEKKLCYATGKILTCTEKHPAKIRNTGDKAKLLSANDESGFAYRGRFSNRDQVFSVGYEFSEKAHNALKWLIKKQGWYNDSLTILTWEKNLTPLPPLVASTASLFDTVEQKAEVVYPKTGQAFAKQLSSAIDGYRANLDTNAKIIVMALNSATQGRLAITLYRELSGSRFLANTQRWHEDMAWYYRAKEGDTYKTVVYAPSPQKIAAALYGTEQSNRLTAKNEVVNDTVDRLLPCIIDGRPIPKDMVRQGIIKASFPQCYEAEYLWQEVLAVACSLIKKELTEHKEDCSMAVDVDCTDRSYLYGRLLAIADVVERSSFQKGEERQTNAKRYMSAFSTDPFKYWQIIEEHIQPYLDKLDQGLQIHYNKMLGEICDKFTVESFSRKERLDGKYLLGYQCQINAIYHNNKEEN